MNAYFQSLTVIQKVFALCMLVGGTVFVLRSILLFFGMGHDVDSDGDMAGELHGGLSDTDVSFHFLTTHGITAFFLMFGAVGMALSKHYAKNDWTALTGGAAAGLLTMLLIARLFSAMLHLQSDGTIRMQNAVGQEGVAYLRIPLDGIGKVQIAIQGGLKIFDARARGQEVVQTGERVKVVEVTPENMLIVEKIVA